MDTLRDIFKLAIQWLLLQVPANHVQDCWSLVIVCEYIGGPSSIVKKKAKLNQSIFFFKCDILYSLKSIQLSIPKFDIII